MYLNMLRGGLWGLFKKGDQRGLTGIGPNLSAPATFPTPDGSSKRSATACRQTF